MISKSIFIKGVTDHEGKIYFKLDDSYARLDSGCWQIKAEQVILNVTHETPASDELRPLSCSINLCQPPQFGQLSPRRSTLKLAICLVQGGLGEFVSLTPRSSEFITIFQPPKEVFIQIRNEMTEVPCKDTDVIATLIIAQ